MKIAPFRIERYYAVHEFTAPYMLSSSDAESVAVADLLALEPDASERLGALRLGYTESPGAPELREAIAAMYTTTEADDVVVVSAAEEGIFLAYHALLEPGDHVVVETPCYESALEVATLGRRRCDGLAPFRRRRLGPRPRRARAGAAAGHEARLRQHAAQPHGYLDAARGARARRRPLRRARRVALLRRGLPGARARPGDPPARRLRPLRARPLARLRLEDLRPAGPPARLARLARARRSRPDRRPQALHDDLCERPERAPLRRRAPAPRHARGAEPRHRARATCRFSTPFSSVGPSASRGRDRARARSASSACTASTTRRRSASRSSPTTGVLLLPGSVYDEPEHVRVGYGRANMPDVLARLESWLEHGFLTEPDESSQLIRKVSEHPADTPFCRRRNPSGGATADGRRTEAHDVDRLVPLRAARPGAGPCGGIGVRDGSLRGGAEPRCREEEGSGMSAVETQSDDVAEESRPRPGREGPRLADRAAACGRLRQRRRLRARARPQRRPARGDQARRPRLPACDGRPHPDLRLASGW